MDKIDDAAEDFVDDVSAILEEMHKPASFRRTPDEVMAARRTEPGCRQIKGTRKERQYRYRNCGGRECVCKLADFLNFANEGPTKDQIES